MRWPTTRRNVALVAVVLASAASSRAFAQSDAEPVAVLYDAPSECPDNAAFFREITARTTRARAARAGEKARVVHVAIVKRPVVARMNESLFTGRLLIEETTSWSSAREVEGATCGEVVEALGLIAALAVDPKASMAPRATISAPPTETAAPVAKEFEPGRVEPPVLERPARPVPAKHPVEGRPSRTRLAIGAQAEGAAVADFVFAGRLFGEMELGDRTGIVAPALRLGLARSLDVDRRPAIGAATLRWTQASVEGCPLRLPIVRTLAVRPCVGASGGALEAESTGIAGGRSRTRPWGSVSAHGRVVWEPASLLAIELEGGAVLPLFRETFFFEPSVPVYEAPPVAFFGRAGVALRFP